MNVEKRLTNFTIHVLYANSQPYFFFCGKNMFSLIKIDAYPMFSHQFAQRM